MTKVVVHEVINDFTCEQDDMSHSLPEIACGPGNRTGSVRSQGIGIACERLTGVNMQRHGLVAVGAWWQNSVSLGDVQEELHYLLLEIENNLQKENLFWADVLYIHLFLNDMTDFSKANEIYAQHITERDSVRGVPSRCCVELPLGQAEMGRVAVEVLAAVEPTKQVLHVQSMSLWAPCCIGPYSQATQYQQLIYMAGQLGFDPPTMTLVPGGAACEMAQALRNCKAVSEPFTSTFLPSVLSFTVYCSSAAGLEGASRVQAALENYLSVYQSDLKGCVDHRLLKPLVLYILVPSLPKGALVEVAPFTHASSDTYSSTRNEKDVIPWRLISRQLHSNELPGVQMRSTCEGLILRGYLCRAFVFLSSHTRVADELPSHRVLNGPVALRQGLELMLKVLQESALRASDIFMFRVYFVAKEICVNDLRKALEDCLEGSTPRPMLIPVLCIGSTADMQSPIAMELTASRGDAEFSNRGKHGCEV